MKRYLIYSFAVTLLSFSACVDKDVPDPTSPAPVITSGTADFSRYIAIGTSLSAGYTNGGLYQAGQQVAFPNLLAAQMKLAGGGSFTSPLFPADQPNGTGYLKLSGYNTDGTPIITQVAPQAIREQTSFLGFPVTLYTKYTGELNNYGIPGIKVNDIPDYYTFGNVNGYYDRLLAGSAGNNRTAYDQFVSSKKASFFTLELGSNDVLDYATSDGLTSSRVITGQTTFSAVYKNLITTLTTVSPLLKGVLVTIPDVTMLPYFRYNTLATLNSLTQKKGLGATNPVIQALYTPTGTYITRFATNKDLFAITIDPDSYGGTNPANGKPRYGIDFSNPLPSSAVLDVDELARVQTAITGYNNSIKSTATLFNYPVFDANTLFSQLQKGITQDGVTVNADFITGGFFSLDGIHLTPRGNALVTDELIKVINAKYGSSLPALDISKYDGVKVN